MKKAIILILAACSTGCAVNRDFYAMGGSRADGTVEMAHDIRLFEKSVVNMDQAYSLAKQKCSKWGYNDAEPFGGQRERCEARNGYGDCLRGQMIFKFQCLGDLNAPKPAPQAGAAPSIGMGKWQYQADQVSLSQSCSKPVLVNSGAGVEIYSLSCNNAPAVLRCDFGSCSIQ